MGFIDGRNGWLGSTNDTYMVLTAQGESHAKELIPCSIRYERQGGYCVALGLYNENDLQLIGLADDDQAERQIVLRPYGSAAGRRNKMIESLEAWDGAGKPKASDLSIETTP